jgi:hypothetical protein
MSDNKFIKHLRGEPADKSVLEIKNQRTTTSFANMPSGTSNANDVYSDHRGNAAAVLKGTENWKLNGNALIQSSTVYGDGRDFTDSFVASGNGLWVNASHTFANPAVFTAKTKWVLKLCGHSLDTIINNTVSFTLLIKFGQAITIAKIFEIRVESFDFSEEMVIDFDEGYGNVIKAAAGSQMTVQLLCADPNASATIYNGMTVFTALQRRVDGDAVASDTKTFEELEAISDAHISNKNNPHEVTKAQVGLGNCDNTSDLDKPISTATQTALDGKVNDTGDTLTGLYKHEYGSRVRFMAANSTVNYTDLFMNGSEFEILFHTSNSIYDGLYGRATNGYVTLYPGTDNQAWLGLGSRRWNRIFVTQLCPDTTSVLTLPNETGVLATKADVDLAANSGDQLTEKGVWYAKMYSATVAPSAENGTNYADFSQVDGQGNPIIVTYNRVNGAWVQDETITPPAEYNGYVTVTSKIWDIAEQAGQQGGKVLWSHNQKTFTPYPQIISFDGQNIINSTFSYGTITQSIVNAIGGTLDGMTITNSTFSGEATLSASSTITMAATPANTAIASVGYVKNYQGKQIVSDETFTATAMTIVLNDAKTIYCIDATADTAITIDASNTEVVAGVAKTFEIHISCGANIPTITWSGIDAWLKYSLTTPIEPNATSIFALRVQQRPSDATKTIVANYGGAY